jgi:hypothetical protein
MSANSLVGKQHRCVPSRQDRLAYGDPGPLGFRQLHNQIEKPIVRDDILRAPLVTAEGFVDYLLQRHVFLYREFAAVIEFWRNMEDAAVDAR